MRIFARMRVEKDFSLATKTQERMKNSHIQEKPEVSLQFNLVITLLSIFMMTWRHSINLFVYKMLFCLIPMLTNGSFRWDTVSTAVENISYYKLLRTILTSFMFMWTWQHNISLFVLFQMLIWLLWLFKILVDDSELASNN